jgi:Holliday junction resolvasome RuvABC endonuclease subunit
MRRDESAGMRLIRLRGKLNEILYSQGVELVIFEAARNAGPHMQGALVVQSELQGVIKLWCEDNDIQYKGVSPTEIKKHATRKGNAKKVHMIAAAKKKWPEVEIVDDNQADAMWILDFAKTII